MRRKRIFAWKESILAGIVSGCIVILITSVTASLFYKKLIKIMIEPKVVIAKDGTKYTFMSNGGIEIEENNGKITYSAPKKPWL